MQKAFIGDVHKDHLYGRFVLVRVDFNVPLKRSDTNELIVSSDARIRNSLETIQYLRSSGAKIVLCSHLGRPKGREHDLSLEPAADKLGQLIVGASIQFIEDCIGRQVRDRIESLYPGEILVLENLRFYKEEQANDENFARELVLQMDYFVNDAFSASHRADASICGVAKFIEKRYAGFAMKKELDYLLTVVSNPKRPLAAVIGGVKVSTKIDLIMNLLQIVDKILIGGAMVNTFYRALGHSTGDSAVEERAIDTATEILKQSVHKHLVFRLASDCVVVSSSIGKSSLESSQFLGREGSSNFSTVSFDSIPPNTAAIDIGQRSIEDFKTELESCETIIWNGPLGKYEEYPDGTNEMIRYLTDLTHRGKITIVCGGDTIAAIEQCGDGEFSHVSMGGGAALELLAGKHLPGVDALMDSDTKK